MLLAQIKIETKAFSYHSFYERFAANPLSCAPFRLDSTPLLRGMREGLVNIGQDLLIVCLH